TNSDVIDDEDRPNTPQKVIESGYHLRLKSEGGTKTSGFMSKQNPAFIPMAEVVTHVVRDETLKWNDGPLLRLKTKLGT
nr:protein NPG1-like [Tanacetum cinerariifolium]